MMTPNHSANQPCDPVEQAYSWPFSGLAVCDSLHGLPKSWEDVYFFLPEFLSFLPRLPIRDWVPGSWGWSNPIQWYWSLWCQRLQWMCVALWRTGRLRTLELWFKVRFDLAESENHIYACFREDIHWKKTFSFGHCPNYLTPPPWPPTWSSFFGTRNSRFESQFRTKNTIYTI